CRSPVKARRLQQSCCARREGADDRGMPARVTVYCRRTISHLTPAALRAELDAADLYTLAECLELPEGEEAAVDAMRPLLRIEGQADSELSYAEVHWKEEGRPIQIERVADEGSVRTDVDEVIENWLDSEEPGARRV